MMNNKTATFNMLPGYTPPSDFSQSGTSCRMQIEKNVGFNGIVWHHPKGANPRDYMNTGSQTVWSEPKIKINLSSDDTSSKVERSKRRNRTKG